MLENSGARYLSCQGRYSRVFHQIPLYFSEQSNLSVMLNCSAIFSYEIPEMLACRPIQDIQLQLHIVQILRALFLLRSGRVNAFVWLTFRRGQCTNALSPSYRYPKNSTFSSPQPPYPPLFSSFRPLPSSDLLRLC